MTRVRRAAHLARRGKFGAIAIASVLVITACSSSTHSNGSGGSPTTAPAGQSSTASSAPSNAGQASGAAAQAEAGVGSAAAKAAPDCDPKTGRIKVPIQYAPACVRPWSAGADNGGKTAQGVTATTIDMVVVMGGLTDTDKNRAQVKQMVNDYVNLFGNEYQTWGRHVNVTFEDFGPNTLPDETQQRAMAVTISGLHPFMVLDQVSASVMDSQLAQQGILVLGNIAPLKDEAAFAPYLWAVVEPGSPDLLMASSAQYVENRLMGKPARWAGDPAYQKETRTFALVYPNATPDLDFINSQFAQAGVKLTEEIAYDPVPQFSAEAPTIVSKLKAKGITTVIDAVDPIDNSTFTKVADAQNYFPEWFSPGVDASDLTILARQNDPKEWAHAFGFGQVPPAPAKDNWWNTILDWYYGPNQPAWRSSNPGPGNALYSQFLLEAFTGIHMAGPTLNANTFRAGMFAYPASGGTYCGCITTNGVKYGPGIIPGGADNYNTPVDVDQYWWDPNLVAADPIAGITAKGNYRYMYGGQRTPLFGHWPQGEPPAFQIAGSISTNDLTTLPASDTPPTYPCSTCPSSGSSGPGPGSQS
jgi:hypothetical protein